MILYPWKSMPDVGRYALCSCNLESTSLWVHTHLLLLVFLVAFQILPRLLEMGCLAIPGVSWIGAVHWMVALSISPRGRFRNPIRRILLGHMKKYCGGQASDNCWLFMYYLCFTYLFRNLYNWVFILCSGAACSLACCTCIILWEKNRGK